jgi:hypothetical protein
MTTGWTESSPHLGGQVLESGPDRGCGKGRGRPFSRDPVRSAARRNATTRFPEITRLGKTLKQWRDAFLTYLDRARRQTAAPMSSTA